jgi:hypothetical protein
MTPNENGLFLTIINDGSGDQCGENYQTRCKYALENRQAYDWHRIAQTCNNWNRRAGGKDATPLEILHVAAYVLEYYIEHVKE